MENFLDKLNVEEGVKTQIQECMKENKVYFTTLENSEIRYNKLKEKLSNQEEMLNELNTLKDEKQSFIEKETLLKKEIEQLKNDYQTQSLNFKKETYLNSLLNDVDSKYVEILKKHLDLSIVKDDDFSSIDEQVNTFKEKFPEFFNQSFSSKQSFKGSTKNQQITKEMFSKMTYKERLKLYNENKELYDKLTK